MLEERWAALLAQLRDRLGEAVWTEWSLWTVGLHCHRFDPDLIELGLESQGAAAFVGRRFGRLLSAIASRPVVAIGCAGAVDLAGARSGELR